MDAHQIIIRQTRKLARRSADLGDDGTNDLLVSEVLHPNEFQVWFLSEHMVNVPLVEAEEPSLAGTRTGTLLRPPELFRSNCEVTMKAILREFGGPGVVGLEEVPAPLPAVIKCH